MAKSKTTARSKKGIVIAFIIQGIALIITAVLVTGYLITGTADFTQWGGYVKPNTREVVAVSCEGEALHEGGTYAMPDGITFFSARSAVNDTELVTTKKIILTPTLSNEYIKGEFDWSLEYAADLAPDDNSGAVEEHFTITPTDDGRQAELIYTSKLFNTPIELTVQLRGTDSEATCTLGCMRNVDVVNSGLNMDDLGYSLEFCSKFKTAENGTTVGELAATEFYISLTDTFTEYVQNYLKFTVNFTVAEYEFNPSLIVPEEELFSEISYDFVTDLPVNFSNFIEGFDDYDKAHKDAIYFAWRQAVITIDNEFGYNENANICVVYNYSYSGYSLWEYSWDYEEVGSLQVPYSIWSTVTPDVNLNGNYVFS